jgi:protein-tyrosine-phosphatase
MNARGAKRYIAFSAGSNPKPLPDPDVLRVLDEKFHLSTEALRSKSICEFEGQEFDFIITLCDRAKEHCPRFPGSPIYAHWSSPDPAELDQDLPEKERLIADIAGQISQRISYFISMPIEKIENQRQSLEQRIQQIGETSRI